jgi:CRISPR-associated protein Csb2
MKHADQPPAEVLSGHRADGSPAERPHLAVVPLPFVGHRHADGAVLGVALVLPRACDDEERGAVLRAVGRWEESHRRDDEECPIVPVILGATGVLQVERVSWGPPPARTLRAETWCRPSRRWISATPVALDRNPGDLRARSHEKAEAAFREAERTIAESCANLGLPVPIVVVVFPSVTMPGTWKAREFPPFPAGAGRIRRVKVHVSLEFDRAVRGPILLGAGRYLGLGLFCPVGEEE